MCVLLCQIEMYREIYYNAGALAGVRGALVWCCFCYVMYVINECVDLV